MRIAILCAIFLLGLLQAVADDMIRTAADLYRAVYEAGEIGRPFDLTLKAAMDCRRQEARIFGEDETGGMILVSETPATSSVSFRSGDLLHITGSICRGKRSLNPYAKCLQIEVIGGGSAPEPTNTTIRCLLDGLHDCRLATISGIVRDVFLDEIDPDFVFLILVFEGDILYVPFAVCRASFEDLNRLVGSRVSLTGFCVPQDIAARRAIGRIFFPANGMESIRLVEPATADPFDVPLLQDTLHGSPQEIARLGRRRAMGCVIAVWDKRKLLVRTSEGRILGVVLADDDVPAYGQAIEVVGFPESDLYRINLARAFWRSSAQGVSCDETPRTITVSSFMTDAKGCRCYDPYAHGQVLRLVGTVVSLPSAGNDDGRLSLRNDDYIVPVDFSANPGALMGIEVGCSLEVTGTCIMESENWQPNSTFPCIRGFALVVRTPADVRILARPPWWTIGKLLAVIGSMLALLAAIVVWNILLRRVAERRGRQLLKAQIAQTTASLKVEERTRLAVELHDAISQTLTGASMRIDAARKLLDHDREKTARQLAIASTTLDSCREELKNCIWDLRNEALDERDLNEAIRLTLARGIGEAKLTVRFNIPRTRLSDNTTNAILCIIRELAVNAVRHGRATELRIAGSIEDANLLFSVRDNGSGFSPDEAPGVAQGHFGLQGIRERLKRLNGSLVFSRPSEGGTRAVVRIRNTLIHEEKVSS